MATNNAGGGRRDSAASRPPFDLTGLQRPVRSRFAVSTGNTARGRTHLSRRSPPPTAGHQQDLPRAHIVDIHLDPRLRRRDALVNRRVQIRTEIAWFPRGRPAGCPGLRRAGRWGSQQIESIPFQRSFKQLHGISFTESASLRYSRKIDPIGPAFRASHYNKNSEQRRALLAVCFIS